MNRHFWKGAVCGFAFAALAAAAMAAGYRAGQLPGVLKDSFHVEKLRYIEKMIDEYYLEEKNEEDLAEGLYTGLVYGLGDPYSRYYTAQDYQEEDISTEGSYVGIGITLMRNVDGYAEISDVYDSSAASRAGLKTGDWILSVNGEDVTEMELGEISDLIHAEEEITLQILRGEDYLDFTLEPAEVVFPSVCHWMLEGNVGYIAITEFTGVTAEQFAEAMDEVRKAGAEKLIIDVRGNPGGLMDASCEVLRQILPEGLIVYTEDRNGEREEIRCDGENALDLPLVVLVDSDTGSAAEIFAGAVQDHGIGTLVGTTTYGKGIVQTIRVLSDGSAVKLTTARYYTPGGNNIHGTGISPDVEVEYDPFSRAEEENGMEMDNQVKAALEILDR